MLHVHRAERADGLVEALRSLLGKPLPDPFAAEVVAVPTHGMERWLTQQLCTRLGATPGRIDGVCANIDFPSPHRLIRDAVATASGVDAEDDPWAPERSVWQLLEVVDGCLGEPWLRPLAHHLGRTRTPPDPMLEGRRFSTVRHFAELFDRYELHRPDMVRAWATGDDTDGRGHPLPARAAWQAELWRRLRAHIGAPGPAERIDAACRRIRDEPTALDLPERISLFGLTRLPAGHVEVLAALGAGRDVHLLLLHPSPAMWSAVAALEPPATMRRATDPTATLPANRLLASWGRDSREMQLVLASAGIEDHHHTVTHPEGTLLARLQADVRADSAEREPLLLEAGDRSLQIHACHGRARQVEVLRDAILHALAEDPSLEPRDVIVMCPDIETFAPLIQATFGAGEVSADDELEPLPPDVKPIDLRVRLADRALRQTNPVLGVVAQLIDLADKRLTASQVLDLADREPVRRRFRLDDDDLTRLQRWISDSGIRWGLDAEHRAPFKLDKYPNGTWRAGLDRVLLGVTMTEDDQRLFRGVLPLDDVESGAIDLAGRLAELVARLEAAVEALQYPQPIGAWADTIGAAADALTSTSERDSWQRVELQRLLERIVAEGGESGTELTLPEIRALLAGRLQGRPTRANFRTGHLTICTLVPMRSVPHRVVCLLGLDDGAFPRKGLRDGDDLMLDDPRVGEREPRAEDRQLLLDALMAATDRLIITYTGKDERTNAPLPPAVPVGELLDVVEQTARTADGPAREHVVVRHPLQPFDPRNFNAEPPWSFDSVTLAGARALIAPRSQPGSFLSAPLPPKAGQVVELEDLVRFIQHPVRAFLRQRLEVSVADYSDELEDDLRVQLDGLQRWGVGDRLLAARLAGVDARPAILAEIARGTLPPGSLGKPVIDDVAPLVEQIVGVALELAPEGAERGSVDVRLALPTGRVLNGTVPDVRGDLLLTTMYSKVGAKHRLAAWARLLALTAAHPGRPFAAATVGRGEDGLLVSQFGPLAPEAAVAELTALLDLYDRGMREPLPIYCKTSAAYAAALRAGRDAVAAAREAWTSDRFDHEDKELEHQLVLGGVARFDDLLVDPPAADEQGEGWDVSQSSRFGRLACRLWTGPLSHEEISSR